MKAYHGQGSHELKQFDSPLLSLFIVLFSCFAHVVSTSLSASDSEVNKLMTLRLFQASQAFENKISFYQRQLLYFDLDLLRLFGGRDVVGGCEVAKASFGAYLESESAHIGALREHGRILAFNDVMILEYAFSD